MTDGQRHFSFFWKRWWVVVKDAAQIVLLSGGLDSVVNLALALQKGSVSLALTFDYGQRARAQETKAAGRISAFYTIRHRVVSLPWMAALGGAAILEQRSLPPRVCPQDLDDPIRSAESARAVWVPNRNGVFVQIAAAYAEAEQADWVVAGFNREEAASFPDNSGDFLETVNAALRYSTRTGVRVRSFTLDMDKVQIVRTGLELGVPLEDVWSCYLGGERMCGQCESCRRFQRAVAGTRIEEIVKERFAP